LQQGRTVVATLCIRRHISPALQADHRQVLKEMNDPGYHDRIQRMLDSIDDNDETLSQEAL
jgi:hypothetical protein